uniref:Uncharacterized protein n=1 Tax=Anguilla anguilla TaxID=7936 RepID=A0A0E9XMD9_ANGAN
MKALDMYYVGLGIHIKPTDQPAAPLNILQEMCKLLIRRFMKAERNRSVLST